MYTQTTTGMKYNEGFSSGDRKVTHHPTWRPKKSTDWSIRLTQKREKNRLTFQGRLLPNKQRIRPTCKSQKRRQSGGAEAESSGGERLRRRRQETRQTTAAEAANELNGGGGNLHGLHIEGARPSCAAVAAVLYVGPGSGNVRELQQRVSS